MYVRLVVGKIVGLEDCPSLKVGFDGGGSGGGGGGIGVPRTVVGDDVEAVDAFNAAAVVVVAVGIAWDDSRALMSEVGGIGVPRSVVGDDDVEAVDAVNAAAVVVVAVGIALEIR